MIDFETLRDTFVKLIKDYMKIPVIRLNQNANPPDYPYIGYTITTPMNTNNGTYSETIENGVRTFRKDFTQTWSFSVFSNKDLQSKELTFKLYDYLDIVGALELSDNGVDIQKIGNITPRDNILTTEYEYRNGFDITIALPNIITEEVGEEENVEAILDFTVDYTMN